MVFHVGEVVYFMYAGEPVKIESIINGGDDYYVSYRRDTGYEPHMVHHDTIRELTLADELALMGF